MIVPGLAGLRILLVGDYPPPYGGIAVHVQDLHAELQIAGATVRVLALGGQDRAVPQVNTVDDPLSLAASLARHAGAGYLVHAHISGHTPKSWLIALGCGLVRSTRSGAPLLTIHGGQTVSYLAASRWRRMLARAILGRFGTVVGVDPSIAAALALAGASRERLRVVPAFSPRGVRVGDLPQGFAAMRSRHAPLLCAAVTDRPVHGAHVLLEALAVLAGRHAGVAAVLFGTVGPALEGLARTYGVEDRVAFLGELPRPQAQAAIANCDVFVRPTFADGDAISVREALMLGRPVVASAVGTRPAGVVLFRPGDADDLARATEEALARGATPAPAEDGVAQVLELYAHSYHVR